MRNIKIGVVIHTALREQIFTHEDWSRLQNLGEVVATESRTPITAEAACEILKGCEVGMGSWGTPYPNPTIMANCPQLRLWEHAAGTVKHMFGAHMEGSPLKIASCKGAIADSVAEMVLGQILLGLRGVFENARENRKGIASKPKQMRTLAGASIGIIGASEVGRRVIRLLRAFPCRILLYDPYCTSEQAQALGTEPYESLEALCRESDVVSLHVPDLDETADMMNSTLFQAMKDDTIFINSARGRSVDEAALIAELEKGRLFAFLDVSAPEPAVADSPFRTLPNVVYTSHIAGPPTVFIGKQAVDDIEAYVHGRSPLCIVLPETLGIIA